MYPLLRNALFMLPPESAHSLTLRGLAATLATPGVGAAFRSQFRVEDAKLQRSIFGIPFANPVGLAAGFDKDGRYYQNMSSLGFGFIELGTVTPKPQSGNPRPRLFRLSRDRALINRMGFNNDGVDALVERLKRWGRPGNVVLGGNIGKNKATPNDHAADDYRICFERLFPFVDYFVVNVSSPNTPNLRQLQDRKPLTALLNQLQDLNQTLASGNDHVNSDALESNDAPENIAHLGVPGQLSHTKPILLKIAPDLTDPQLDDILDIVSATGIAGIVATNTTIERAPLTTDAEKVDAIGAGGLSGRPLRERSTEVIRYLYENSGRELDIIGVGGIDSPESAMEKIDAGAKLIQIYSGMVYAGPGLVRDINRQIIASG